LLALSHSIWPSQKNFELATLLLVTIFIQTACISLAPSHVPQYQTFDTALPYLMFNFPLTKSSQQRKTARHCNILIVIMRCIFARFKVNCEAMTPQSFANFKLTMSRHMKELRGAPKPRDPRPWPMRRSVTDHSTT